MHNTHFALRPFEKIIQCTEVPPDVSMSTGTVPGHPAQHDRWSSVP